jgi:hypothetical protein
VIPAPASAPGFLIEARYDLLETVRQYAAERLEDTVPKSRAGVMPNGFSRWRGAEPELSGEHQTRWFSVLELEHDNARAALAVLLEQGEAALSNLGACPRCGRQEDIAWCLEGFAALATRAGDGERAATLSGAAGALLRTIGADFKPFERRLHDSTEARAHSLCGAGAFEEASSRGASLPLGAVLELIRAGQSSSSVSSTELLGGPRT